MRAGVCGKISASSSSARQISWSSRDSKPASAPSRRLWTPEQGESAVGRVDYLPCFRSFEDDATLEAEAPQPIGSQPPCPFRCQALGDQQPPHLGLQDRLEATRQPGEDEI